MSKKSLYKRAVDPWSDDVKEHTRAKEDKMFEQIDSDVVGKKSKSKAKGTPRSNHKHDYKPVIVWSKSCFSGKISGYLASKCSVCGKMEKRYYSLFGGKSEKTYLGELEHLFEDIPIDSKTYQKTIFLGGSKIINRLDERIKEDLIDYMNLGYKIIIGDCMGADLQMQKILEENNYKKVTVYYSGDRPRFNLGNWKTKHISSNKYLSEYERQKLKDNQMAIDCDKGYMLLKGMTKGTMANIEKLVKLDKSCKVVLTDYSGIYPYGFTIEEDKDIERIKWSYEKFDKR